MFTYVTIAIALLGGWLASAAVHARCAPRSGQWLAAGAGVFAIGTAVHFGHLLNMSAPPPGGTEYVIVETPRPPVVGPSAWCVTPSCGTLTPWTAPKPVAVDLDGHHPAEPR